MRIEKIRLRNFRIYKGENEISFTNKKNKNISLIAGKNGFGKTTFLTSLIWTLYGNFIGQVEEKYKKDIRNAGGYDGYLKTLLNKQVKNQFEAKEIDDATLLAEVHLTDVLIPSVPCKQVIIRRHYNYRKKKEKLQILIDGQENELTKEVGYEIFINDFILPREIAKFFFFDAEKIVSLAEAKTKAELKTLSKAYSEVLGIKKYEDLKSNLSALQTKLRRSGAQGINQEKFDELLKEEKELKDLLQYNNEKLEENQEQIQQLKTRIDQLQEKLIREGNELTLEQLKEMKKEKADLKKQVEKASAEMRQFYELLPFLMAPNAFKSLVNQLKLEKRLKKQNAGAENLFVELNKVEKELIKGLEERKQTKKQLQEIKDVFDQIIASKKAQNSFEKGENLLNYSNEQTQNILNTYEYVNGRFKEAFDFAKKQEKDLRLKLTRITNKIKQGEARKDNPLAQKIRAEKEDLSEKLHEAEGKKETLTIEKGQLEQKFSSNQKVLSEYEKKAKLIKTDQEKYAVTEKLLAKITTLTERIKEEKKYSLEKAILIGLNRLMHKEDFIAKVKVNIHDEVMDIDLIDHQGHVIDKDNLSKGEQQLYATALLKALVDESGINFPVFIDSPLQKFDKHHSANVIQQFYPTISDQVVLFPLLEKELSQKEYELLKPNLKDTFLIQNQHSGSSITACAVNKLFETFNAKDHVYAH